MDVGAMAVEPVVRELEATLGRVRGVAAARVVLNERGDVETIHLLAAGSRSPDQIAADVAAVCAALFNLPVHPRQLRVSLLEDGPAVAPAAAPELHSLTVESTRHGCRVTVKLRAGDGLYEGEVVGADVVSARPRLAAEAALAAVAQWEAEGPEHDSRAAVALYDLQTIVLGPKHVVLAALVADERRAGGEERWLVGCALVEKDLADAAVRAVLDAVGRRPRAGAAG